MGNLETFDIKPYIIESIVEVFDTLFSVTLEPATWRIADGLEGVRKVGTISFAGDITGMLSIHVSEAFARELAAKMLARDPAEIDGDEAVRGMLGEVGNIVGGNLKSAFTDAGLTCDLSTPSVASGTDFNIEALNMEKYERLAFKCGERIVLVELGIKTCDLAQVSGQRGKDIHYSANEDSKPEQGKPTTSEVQGQGDAGEAESDSGNISQAEPAAPQDSSPAGEQEAKSSVDVDLDLLLDIPLEIKVELGRTKIEIHELLKLVPGSAVKLTKLEGEPVDILANDTLIAKGEVMVQREKYGIRVTEITSRLDRIRSFGFS